MDQQLQRILPEVQKPARYTGGEYNEIKKDKQNVDLRVAFCFPDTYEIGLSNLGLKILYGLINKCPPSGARGYSRRGPIWKKRCAVTRYPCGRSRAGTRFQNSTWWLFRSDTRWLYQRFEYARLIGHTPA